MAKIVSEQTEKEWSTLIRCMQTSPDSYLIEGCFQQIEITGEDIKYGKYLGNGDRYFITCPGCGLVLVDYKQTYQISTNVMERIYTKHCAKIKLEQEKNKTNISIQPDNVRLTGRDF